MQDVAREQIRGEQVKATRSMILMAAVLLGGGMAIAMAITAPRPTPYMTQVMSLQGNSSEGKLFFENNCAACHGLKGEGKVGPNLGAVTKRLSDEKLITQVTSGDTPPMPRYPLAPQQMADLLAHLKEL